MLRSCPRTVGARARPLPRRRVMDIVLSTPFGQTDGTTINIWPDCVGLGDNSSAPHRRPTRKATQQPQPITAILAAQEVAIVECVWRA
eukprot:8559961-Pyramimonas_sp.AAC.1